MISPSLLLQDGVSTTLEELPILVRRFFGVNRGQHFNGNCKTACLGLVLWSRNDQLEGRFDNKTMTKFVKFPCVIDRFVSKLEDYIQKGNLIQEVKKVPRTVKFCNVHFKKLTWELERFQKKFRCSLSRWK